jgi:sensor histidine kinase YesM
LELEKFTRGDTFDFEVNCDSDIDQNDILIPPMLLQPFVENAIIHGFNGLERRGKINVEFHLVILSQSEGSVQKLQCIIRDNGVGREKATNVKIQQESEHKSTALKVTQERLDMLNAGEKSLFIIDIKDENGNPAGTEINILITII